MKDLELIPLEFIQSRIVVLRGQRVILDSDLAKIYGVTTKQLNQQVKRNARKFPADFSFKLTSAEKKEVVTICDHLRSLRFSSVLPRAFSEHGAIQAANVLNSPSASAVSVQIVRAFVRLRQLLVNHKAISAKLSELDERLGSHDRQLTAIVKAIRTLAAPDGQRHRRKIGFHQGNR